MAAKSTPCSSRPEIRLIRHATAETLLGCGIDPAALAYLEPKLKHLAILVREVKLYAANILKQTMLSLGGDAAVHRDAICGRVEFSNVLLIGDERHFRALVQKLKNQPGLRELADEIRTLLRPEEALTLRLGARTHVFGGRPAIMGILNVTDDSFSDGGCYSDTARALEQALTLIAAGAEIIDIGGESTRPGSQAVSAQQEIVRVVPIISALREQSAIPISIDTKKAAVAREALAAGADIINDVSALTDDDAMLEVAAAGNCAVVLMHMRGQPVDMQHDTAYRDIVSEVFDYLAGRLETCLAAGIPREAIVLDPGIGFGKDLAGNLSLIKHIHQFKSLGVPVLLGHSRKTFLGQLLDAQVHEREQGNDAVTAWACLEDVDFVRVHDVKRACQVRTTLAAIGNAR